jgi:hypothetical protein
MLVVGLMLMGVVLFAEKGLMSLVDLGRNALVGAFRRAARR